jgi:mono/diheme cytochrome c family protein
MNLLKTVIIRIITLGAIAYLIGKVNKPTISVESKPAIIQPRLVSKEEMIKLGKKRYKTSCMACHTANPAVGGFGPPNAGSSLELLTLKVLEGKYPVGYKPKRLTKSMPKFPHLKPEIENLYEYLNSVK